MARNKLSLPEMKAREAISANLKNYSHGMTQKELSDKTGIPASTLSGYFAKRSTPNAGALQKLADALGVKKSDIDPRYSKNSSKLKTADLDDDDVLFTYQGKPLSPEDREIIRRLMDGKSN